MARELVDEIITLIRSEANNNPPPKPCKIVKNYGKEPYSDVEVEDLGILIYKKTIGSTKVGSEGIICFLNGDLNQGVVITPSNLNSGNGSYIEDLEIDFNLDFGVSGRDDLITVETFLRQK
jgi:hypothetical protein